MPAVGRKRFKFPVDFPDNGNSTVRAVRLRLGPPPTIQSHRTAVAFFLVSPTRRGPQWPTPFPVFGEGPIPAHQSPVGRAILSSPDRRLVFCGAAINCDGPHHDQGRRSALQGGLLDSPSAIKPQHPSLLCPAHRQGRCGQHALDVQLQRLRPAHDRLHDVRCQERQIDHPSPLATD